MEQLQAFDGGTCGASALTDVLGVRLIRERKDMRKSLQFKVEPLRHKWPLFAFGVMGGGNEFVLSLWLIDFRISWGY